MIAMPSSPSRRVPTEVQVRGGATTVFDRLGDNATRQAGILPAVLAVETPAPFGAFLRAEIEDAPEAV
jgi:hypothetical protein